MAFVDTEKRSAGEVQQKVGRIKLSEAIRIGAKLRPQGYGSYFRDDVSCALGAAFEGIHRNRSRQEVGPMWTNLGITMELHDEIVRRNDEDRWSRESIADWLAAQGL